MPAGRGWSGLWHWCFTLQSVATHLRCSQVQAMTCEEHHHREHITGKKLPLSTHKTPINTVYATPSSPASNNSSQNCKQIVSASWQRPSSTPAGPAQLRKGWGCMCGKETPEIKINHHHTLPGGQQLGSSVVVWLRLEHQSQPRCWIAGASCRPLLPCLAQLSEGKAFCTKPSQG